MRRSAARESSPPKRHFSSFVFSEGASPDAPIFFSAVRENRPQISRFFLFGVSRRAHLRCAVFFLFVIFRRARLLTSRFVIRASSAAQESSPPMSSLTLQVNRRFAPPPSSGQGYIAQFSPSVQVCRRGFGAATISA